MKFIVHSPKFSGYFAAHMLVFARVVEYVGEIWALPEIYLSADFGNSE